MHPVHRRNTSAMRNSNPPFLNQRTSLNPVRSGREATLQTPITAVTHCGKRVSVRTSGVTLGLVATGMRAGTPTARRSSGSGQIIRGILRRRGRRSYWSRRVGRSVIRRRMMLWWRRLLLTMIVLILASASACCIFPQNGTPISWGIFSVSRQVGCFFWNFFCCCVLNVYCLFGRREGEN